MSPYTPVTTVNIYDIDTGNWKITPGPSMLVGTSFSGYVQAGPYLYVVGGFSGDLTNNVTATQRFDMSTQTWTLGPEFVNGRALLGLAVTGQSLYAMGGDQNGDGTPFNFTDLVERLDHTQWPAGVWEVAFSPLPISGAGNAGFCTEVVADGEIWSVGGNNVMTDTNYYHAAEPCFTLYGLTLTPETAAQEGLPGETVTYTLQLTNTGFVTDTYDLTISAVWTTIAPTPIGPLAPGESTTFQVLVTIPGDAVFFDADTALITATSQGDSDKSDTASLITSVPAYWAYANDPSPLTAGGGRAQCADDPDGFYILGGVYGDFIDTDKVFHYDATTGMWEEKAPLPQPHRGQASVCYDGKIYVAGGGVGGVGSLNTFYIYDITTDNWSSGPALPRNVIGAALGAWDGKLYLAGGAPIFAPPYTPVPTVNEYDIASGIWEAVAVPPMNVASGFAGSVQAGPYLYVVGGISGDFYNNVTATQRFDMSTRTWSLGPEFSSGRAMLGLAVTEQHLYAIAGDQDGDGIVFNFTDLVEELDHAQWPNGIWEERFSPLPIAVLGNVGFCTEAIIGGEVWSVAGGDLTGNLTNTTFYHPAEPCFTVFYDLSLTPETDAQTAYAGETVTYTLQVTNTGNVGDSYMVTVDAVWTTTAPALLGPLASGVTETFEVTVTIPEDASPGDMGVAGVTLTSQGDPTQTAAATLTTSVSPYAVTFTPTEAAGSNYVGETVHYMLLLTNMGSVTDTFTLDFTGNLWTVTPSFTETTLGPGVTVEFSVLVSIPAGASDGEMDSVTLAVVSTGDPTQSATATLTTTALWHKQYLPIILR